MSFSNLKDVTNTCQRLQNSQILAGFLQCNGGKLEKLNTSNVVSSCIVYSNRNRSALMYDLLTIIDCLSVSCMKMNHSCCALVI